MAIVIEDVAIQQWRGWLAEVDAEIPHADEWLDKVAACLSLNGFGRPCELEGVHASDLSEPSKAALDGAQENRMFLFITMFYF